MDTDKGLLLKISYIHAIALRTVFRGRRRLTKEEVLAEYGGSGPKLFFWSKNKRSDDITLLLVLVCTHHG